MQMTFTYIAERASLYPQIVRRNQLSKEAFIGRRSIGAFTPECDCFKSKKITEILES